MHQQLSLRRPIRILHVVGGMNRGGVETWLMHVLRHIDRADFQMDFLVHTERPCAYDEEIIALGSRIIPCLSPQRPWVYARNFRRALRAHGPYDVIHSHVHRFSGYVLRLSKVDVPIRIAHSHNDSSSVEARGGLLRRSYVTLTGRWIRAHATVGLSCSDRAAAALFGEAWMDDRRWETMPYGIDLAPFRSSVDLGDVRRELAIPPDAWVIGHVGRFVEQKNHRFLAEVAIELLKREPRAFLLLVGDGPLRPSIEQQVNGAGIAHRVRFAGLRGDVHRLMRGAMDFFLFPSLWEGLGLVLIEAQAAGLPCIISDVIPREADVVGPLIRRVSLAQPVARWVDETLSQRDAANAIPHRDSLAQVECSPFNIQRAMGRLEEIYRAALLVPGTARQ